jgi:tetratricopeptide (TPR) repeat protein
MDAVTHLFELASQNGAVLLLIDDLHWADAASLAMFRHIIGASTAGLHLMIVATYRDSELSPTHPLTRFLADLHREPCVSRLALIGLDDTEVIELIEGAAGYGLDEEGIDLAHALRRETGGNPFFVGEMLRHLGESGAFVMDQVGRFSLAGDVTDLALPPSVRDVVTRRVARLGDEALRVLSLAAVVGQEFSLDVLDAVTETGVEQLLDLLEAATTAAIVIEVPDLPGRYRFLHALIQHTLYHELSAARRQRHHLQVAEALEQSEPAPGDESKHIAELARHWLAATTPAKMAKAIDYCRRAGDAAENALAVVDAAGWYGKALELAERDPTVDRELRCRLLIALGSAQMVTNADPGRTTMREAGTLAEDIGDPDLLVTWATTRLSGWRTSEAADPQALRLTRKALELVGEESATLKARLLGVLTEETDPWEWRERRDLARAARAAAEVAGDDATTLDVFLATDFVISADQAAERSRIAARAVEIAERGTNPISLGAALINYADSLLTLGDIAQARGVISRNQAMAAEYALPPLRHGAEMQGAVLSMVSGDLAALEHHADNMLRLSEEVPQSLATYGGSLFELRWAQGRLSEFAALFSDAVSEMRSYAGFRPAMVVAYLEADDFDRARTLFADDASNGFEAFPRDTIWLACMSLYAEAAIRLADIGAAEALYGLLSPYDALHCAGGPIYYGSVDRSIGGLAAFLGRPEEAEHRLHHALEVHRAVGAQYWTARTGLDLAEHLLNGEGSGRGEEGALLLDECDRLSTTGGYGGVSRRAALLRRRLA